MKIKKSFIALTFICLNLSLVADSNLIKNGSFENFEVKRDRGSWKIARLEDWHGTKAEIWTNSIGDSATDGDYKIELDVGKKIVDKIYQNIDLEVGATYKISIDAYARKRKSSRFYIELDGEKILTVNPTMHWENYSVEFNATKETHKIAIRESSTQNDGLGAILDNVILQKISTNTEDNNSSTENNDTTEEQSSIVYTKFDDNLFLNDKKDVAIYIDEDLNKSAKLIYDNNTIKKITNKIYSHFKDDYDFIFLITNNEKRPKTVSYAGVFMKIKNDIEGIGSPIYNNTQPYGSDGKLKGVMHFAYRSAILKGPTLHEISHYWANKFRFDFNKEPYYRLGSRGHWGYLGFFGGKGQLGGYDANTLQKTKDTDGSDLTYVDSKGNTWNIYSAKTFGWNANNGDRIPYNDLELYLMGMIPKSDVADLMIAMPYDSPTGPTTRKYMVENNLVERGRTYFMAQNLERKSWSEIMNDHSIPDRNPNASSSQKSFKVLTVLLDTQMPKEHEINGISLQMDKFTMAKDDGIDNNYNFWEATRGIGTLNSTNLDTSLKSVGSDYPIESNYQEETISFHGKTYKTVLSPYTGRVWLDRNIGADHVCESFTDSGCYGGYFQFGRGFDGHQLPNSPITSTKKSSITPNDNKFVLVDYKSGYDWVLDGVDDDKSDRLDMVNRTDGSGICPIGFRLPTYDEFYNDTYNNVAWDSFPSDSIDGNFLKLPLNGYRNAQSKDGLLFDKGKRGAYWTSGHYGKGSNVSIRHILFTKDDFVGYGTDYVSNAEAIRCIKDDK